MCADGYSHTAIAKCLNGDERYNEMLRRYLDGRTPQPPQDGDGLMGTVQHPRDADAHSLYRASAL